jgi:hypothetical protein
LTSVTAARLIVERVHKKQDFHNLVLGFTPMGQNKRRSGRARLVDPDKRVSVGKANHL